VLKDKTSVYFIFKGAVSMVDSIQLNKAREVRRHALVDAIATRS
jgi:hypothetical protein